MYYVVIARGLSACERGVEEREAKKGEGKGERKRSGEERVWKICI